MQPWSFLSVGCLLAGGAALIVAQEALAESRDVVALYWFLTGAVSLKASLALSER